MDRMLAIKDLHQYQWTGVRAIIDNPAFALFLDMGLGKTITSLTAANTLMYEELEIRTCLVIAPKRVIESVWQEEAEKWEHTKHLKFSKILGTVRQRRIAVRKKADIYLISRDNIAWLITEYDGQLPYDMLIIDEASSFKNPKSQRFRALRKARKQVKRTVLLTGTPAPNGLIDLWAQVFLLDNGQRLGTTLTEYRDNYFKPDKRNGLIIYSYKALPNAEQRIYERINDVCLSMKAEDYLTLPPFIDNTVPLILPPDVMQMYSDFERTQVLALIDELGIRKEDDANKTITAINAAALNTKLLQFANGAIYDAKGYWHEVHKIKIDATREIVDDTPGGIFIAWSYRHDLERLSAALNEYSPRQLLGKKDIDDWNAGKIKVLLSHPASNAYGINLQKGGNNLLWFGQIWNLELYLQFNKRVHRQGQLRPVISNKLACTGTIDEEVIASIHRKNNKQNELLDAVKYSENAQMSYTKTLINKYL